MDNKTINNIFQRFTKQNPHPTTELKYHSAFELLIAVILSAQATDVSVNKATKKLFTVANTPEKILQLGETNLKKYIQTIGLYNSKAKNIIACCKQLLTEHHGKIPEKREELEKLPGVGRKTANVILNTVFHQPVIAVDTHIFRVANRTGLAHGKTPLEVEKQLMAVIPKKYLLRTHHWLVLHGRYVCTAKKPHCRECLIQAYCQYPNKNL